ncbi:MAG: Cell wall-binding protein [Firmicutes bacterium]|nr:Cell wall-binding protein [Bacillota bacterium]
MRVIVICLSLCMFFQLPAFASNKSDVLKYGMKGSEVKVIQKYLVDLKYLKKGAANGEFDQNTQDAILRFQREVKLKTDGMVGPATREALQHYKPATKETSKAAKPSPADLKQLVRQKQSENLIRLGMKGQEVKEVQEALIKTGFLTGKADGVYGQATFIAVTNLQKDARLTEDGVVGSKTFLALKANKPVKAPRKNAPNNNKPPAAPKPVLPTLPKVHESYNSDHPANWRSIPLESTAYIYS